MSHATRRRDERLSGMMLPGDRAPTNAEQRECARLKITLVQLRERGGITPAPSTEPRTSYAPGDHRRMNKWESDYAERLELLKRAGRISDWSYESENLRLGHRCFYRPDFKITYPDGSIGFDEVKGFWRDDARVKIKAAAARYPEYRFRAVTRKKGEWVYEEIKSA